MHEPLVRHIYIVTCMSCDTSIKIFHVLKKVTKKKKLKNTICP